MVKERVRPDGSTYLSGKDVELEQARLQRERDRRRELANTIALQADAIAKGQAVNEHAAARLLASNAETLVAWTEP